MSEIFDKQKNTALDNGDKFFGIEFASIEAMLQLYCRALTGKEADFKADAGNAIDFRNVWWRQLVSGNPMDGHIQVSVPAYFMQYATWEENFAWYKTIITKQLAHAEFGSFDFSFNKSSNLFEDMRFRTRVTAPVYESSIGNFISLFDEKLLAAQVFTAVENVRINFLVKHYYRGLKNSYIRMQEDILLAVTTLPGMTLRRVFCELLQGLELDAMLTEEIDILYEPLQMSDEILAQLRLPESSVEDSSEAAIRIYEIAKRIPKNMYLSSSGGFISENREPHFSDLEAQEYMGDFNVDKMKLSMEMKNNATKSSSMPMTAEDVKKLADQKIGVSDIKHTQFLPSTGLSSADLPRGVHVYQFSQDKYQQVDRYQPKDAAMPVIPEEGEKIFHYDEWDFRAKRYLEKWCSIREKVLNEGSAYFYEKTLENRKTLAAEIKRQFERLPAEMLYKTKNLDDGDEYDLDLVISELLDKRAGYTPSGKVYWKKKKVQRDVSVIFLLDMSGSTADLITRDRPTMQYDESIKYDFIKFVMQPRRRIIDLEKESIVLLIHAIEALGDTYGIYGFSGHGRSKVQFLVIKDLNEPFAEKIKRRIDQISPIHGTRMGPAIRHAITKLDCSPSSLKLLFLVSDGYPQDAMYGWDDDDKEYAIHDTRMALTEAAKKNITPFCLTVDSSGNDYLRTMCQDIGYEVLDDIESLPHHLPMLYKKLSV